MGEIAAKAAVQLLFSTGKNFTVDGLREKLREFFRQEACGEVRAVAVIWIDPFCEHIQRTPKHDSAQRLFPS